MLAEEGNLEVHSSTKASAEVGRACEDVSKMFIPHEFLAILLDGLLKASETIAESSEDISHVPSFLHGDDSSVVFLVHPDQEVLLLIVPDSPSIRPVSGHAGSSEEGRDWLVEQKVVVNQLLLFLFSHSIQGIVLAFEVSIKGVESSGGDLFHLPPLGSGTEGR